MTSIKPTKIIFICHGNICRSPMAEMIFRQLSKEAGREEQFVVSSAAVSYEEIGNPIYPPAANKLREKGISSFLHSAHRITIAEANESDLLIIMDGSNERLLKRIIPNEQHYKIHYMMEYASKGKAEVSDPWYSGNFERTFQDIYSGCKGLLNRLCNNNPYHTY